jgi:glucosamine-6-phosphate isomerase
MKIIIAESYASMSAEAADDVIECMQSSPDSLLCVASGDSPKGLYQVLAERKNAGALDASKWKYVGLDEWMGLGRGDDGSSFTMIDRDLFKPLGVSETQICFFDGRTKTPGTECDRVEEYIAHHGGITVALVGIGMNGHIGLNEPGTSVNFRSHVAEIDPVTNQVGQKYFTTNPVSLTHGITLGLTTLLESQHIILVVSGANKASILKTALEGVVSNAVPATLIRHHPGFRVYADKEAASLLV